MTNLILHHFAASPFAEKVRVAMGIKQLAWSAVDIPMVMPKPDLMPLTGGYRKTPVLQIGADVYCDTALILEELERRHPTPALFTPEVAGLAPALAVWSDTRFFEPGAGLSMGLNPDLPAAILSDRKAFFEFMDFSQLEASIPHLDDQFLSQVVLVETQLGDGRPFWLGDQVTALDVMAYFPLWMARGNVPGMAQRLSEFTATEDWCARMAAFGHGAPSALASSDALAIALAATPAHGAGVTASHTPFALDDAVAVAPTDYGAVPVTGTLITLNRSRITLRRSSDATGPVNTHFPRSGYRLSPA